MAAGVTKDSLECYYLTFSEDKDRENQFHDITGDFSKREKTINLADILNYEEGQFLICVCDVGQNQEQWVTFAMHHSPGSVVVFTVLPDGTEFNPKTIMESKYPSLNVTTHVNKVKRGTELLNIALTNMDMFITELSKHDIETFTDMFVSEKIPFCKRNSVLQISKKIAENLLVKKFRLKETLERTLSLLQYIIDLDADYILPCGTNKLSATLVAHTFVPRAGDKVDLQKLVYKMFILLQERGQTLHELCGTHFDEFFRINEDDFLDKITLFLEDLKENFNDNVAQTCIANAINDRIELLVCCGKLAPERLTLKMADDIMSLLGDSGAHEALEEKRKQLQESLNKARGFFNTKEDTDSNQKNVRNIRDEPSVEIHLETVNHQTDNDTIHEENENANSPLETPESDVTVRNDEGLEPLDKHTLSEQLCDIEQQFHCMSNCLRLRRNVSLDPFILTLSNIKENTFRISNSTLDCMFERGKLSEDNNVSLAVVRIINILPEEQKLGCFPFEILKNIPLADSDIVFHLAENKISDVGCLPFLLVFFYRVLIEHPDRTLRDSSYKILKGNFQHLSEEMKSTILLEDKYHNNDKDFLTECLNHTKSKLKLSLNCFEQLACASMNEECVFDIIVTILTCRTQGIPESFVSHFKQYLIQQDDQEKISSIYILLHLLMKDGYIKFKDVSHFINIEAMNDEMLKLLYNSILNDNKIADNYLAALEEMSRVNIFAANICQMHKRSQSSIDAARNSRNPLHIRRKALREIINGSINQADVTARDVHVLVSLIRYEERLRCDALEALNVVLPDDYKSNHNIPFELEQVLSSSHCNELEVKYVKDLALKDSSVDIARVIDFILGHVARATDGDQEVLISCLQEVVHFRGQQLNVGQTKKTYEVAVRSDSPTVRNALLYIIREFVTQEDIAREIGLEEFSKNDAIEKLTCESTDDLFTLKTIVESGFILPRDKITNLASSLVNPVVVERYQVISEILQLVSRNQTLSSECITIITNAIEENEDLLNSTDLVSIFLEYSMDITDKILSKLWRLFASGCFRNELNKLVACLLLSEYTRGVPYLEVYKGEENPEANILCQQISIKLLEVSIENNKLDANTLQDYFSTTMKAIQDDYNIEHLSIVSNFYDNETIPCEEKYTFLKFIKNSVYDRECFDINTLVDYPECDWVKETLCTLLLIKALKCSKITTTDDDIKHEVIMFTANVSTLQDLSSDGESTKIIQVLEDMLHLQIKHKVHIKDINDILRILWDDETAKEILKKKSDETLAELKILFLTNKLKEHGIVFSDEQLIIMQELTVSYRPHLLSNILENINRGCNIINIISFFTTLDESYLSVEQHINFLSDSEDNLTGSPHNWIACLYNYTVRELIYHNEMLTALLENKHVIEKCATLISLGWKLPSVEQICVGICNSASELEILGALDIIIEYKLKEYDSNVQGTMLIDLISYSSTSTNSRREIVHELAIFQRFDSRHIKNTTQLRKEILEELNIQESLPSLLAKPCKDNFDQVLSTYEGLSNILSELGSIEFWGEDNIRQWSDKVREDPSQVLMVEKVAVVRRALFLHVGEKYYLREVQLMSALVLLSPHEQQGRLAQINTGEGKTMIVSMLAVIKALDGHQVDVITSSPELARPQCDEQRSFFKMFGLSAAHNGSDGTKVEQRYLADIVYGAASDFQGDILRDEYSLLGTRSGRRCDVAIVDEVDSMLIDGRNHMVMLSSPMPAMDHLEPVLAAIWMQIGVVANCVKERDGVTYFSDYQDRFKADGTIDPDKEEELVPIEGSKADFVKMCVVNHIRKILWDEQHLTPDEVSELSRMGDKFPRLFIPTHLWHLVTEAQIERWVDCAIYAKYKCDEGRHYILIQGNISPVDAVNTGIVQRNMHWNNGLHQFLQIKHGSRISAESFTTNFLSNVSFFRRYGSEVVGLTGTLGSVNAKLLLHETYAVDSVVIPPFKHKQYQELSPLISYSKPDWYNDILESTINKLQLGRAVLIITKYIAEVNDLVNLLFERNYEKSKVKVYRTAEDSKVIKEKLMSGEIIVATNIAGRGTDIKVAVEVERNGGLHVCITFVPPNERVEHQNVGRTSRTGNRGTGQFVVLAKHGADMKTLREQRNLKEENALQNARLEITKIVTKDKIFQRFCSLLSLLFDNKPVENKLDKMIKKIRKRSLEDRFGIWLKIQETLFEGKDESTCLEMFDQFMSECSIDHKNGKLIANPFFHVLCGNEYVKENRFKQAIFEFDRAIEMDEYFAANAYYGRGYARVALYGRNGKNHHTHINDAVKDFQRARDIIEHHLEPLLQIIQLASDSECLSEQVKHKTNLYGVQKTTIDTAIGIGVGKTDKQIKDLENSRTNKTKEDIKLINEHIKALNECDKEERDTGIIGKAKNKKRGVEIKLIPLKDVFPSEEDICLYEAEIIEYENNGFIGNFKVTEIVPTDWWSVFVLLIIGLVQMIAGAALMILGSGILSSIGSSLISEGVSDMVTAITDGIINKTFDWAQWGIQKAVSLAVGLLCAGFSALKNIIKTAVTGVTSVAKMAGHTVKSVCLKIGKEVAKAGATAIIDELVDRGVDRAIMPSIRQALTESIEPHIQAALQENPYVHAFLKLDGENRDRKFEKILTDRISKLIQDDVRKEGSLFSKLLDGVIDGMDKKSEEGLYGKIKKFLSLTMESHKLITFVDNFKLKMRNEINKMAKEFKIEGISSPISEERPIQEKTIDTFSLGDVLDDDEDIDFNKPEAEQVTLECTEKTTNELVNTISKQVVGKMCSILEGKFIKPALTATAKSCTDGLGKYSLKSITMYQAERKLKFSPNKTLNRLDALSPDLSQGARRKEKIKEKFNNEVKGSVDAVISDAVGPWGGAALGVVGGATLAYTTIRKRHKRRVEATEILTNGDSS